MWYKVSDSKDEVVFFSDCTYEQANALCKIKTDSSKRQLSVIELASKPEGISVYGCTRVDVPEKNIFVELFVPGSNK